MLDGWRAGLQDAAPALQVALGLVLLVSGIGKMRDRPALVAGALRYQVLSSAIVRPAAALLPFAELALALALLLGLAGRLTALATAALITAFAIAVGINLFRGRNIPCHCFSASASDRIGPLSLVRLLILLCLALAVGVEHNPPGVFALSSLSRVERWSFLALALAVLSLVLAIGPLQLLLRELASVRAAALWRTPRQPKAIRVASDPPLTGSGAGGLVRIDSRTASELSDE